MEYVLHPQPGYPFLLRLRVEYRLGTDGLTVHTTAENLGDRACPFGVGHHPYIAAPSGRVDDLVLEVPGHHTGPLGSTKLDDAFALDAPWRLRVGDVTVWGDEVWKHVQLFTGDTKPDVARRSLAVEPMTCPPNAFNTGEDLIRIEPGGTFTGSWGIVP
jgi:aldose 1-epimerase